MKLSLIKVLKENELENNQAFDILKKADDLLYSMTVEYNEQISPKQIIELINQYWKLRKMGLPEPKVDNKNGDYLAKQIVQYLKFGDSL